MYSFAQSNCSLNVLLMFQIFGNTIHIYVIEDEYAGRVSNLHTYEAIRQEIPVQSSSLQATYYLKVRYKQKRNGNLFCKAISDRINVFSHRNQVQITDFCGSNLISVPKKKASFCDFCPCLHAVSNNHDNKKIFRNTWTIMDHNILLRPTPLLVSYGHRQIVRCI